MTIFPLVTGVFAKAFSPLAQEINIHQDLDQTSSENKKQSNNKRWFLAVDDGVGYGNPAVLITGMLLVPIMVVIAFLLPGNKTLPVVDLIALPYMIESIVAIDKGNLAKVIANSIIYFSVGLYIASMLGSIYTGAVCQYGVALPVGVVLITSFNLMAHPINGLVFFAWISQNPIWIGLTILIYLAGFILLKTRRQQIWDYLNKMADKNVS